MPWPMSNESKSLGAVWAAHVSTGDEDASADGQAKISQDAAVEYMSKARLAKGPKIQHKRGARGHKCT